MQPQAMATPAVAAGGSGSGLYVARRTPRLPGNLCYVNPNAASLTELTTLGKVGLYNAAFGSDIDIFGVSLSKNIAGISLGAELSYRRNMPLVSEPVFVLPAAFVPLRAGLDRNRRAAGGRHAGRQGQ